MKWKVLLSTQFVEVESFPAPTPVAEECYERLHTKCYSDHYSPAAFWPHHKMLSDTASTPALSKTAGMSYILLLGI